MLRAAVVVAALAGAVLPASANAAVQSRYSIQGGCFAITDGSGKYLDASSTAYRPTAMSAAKGEHFRLKATALGSYMLYDTGARMPSVGSDDALLFTKQPGPSADWTVTGNSHTGFVLRSKKDKRYIGNRAVNGFGLVDTKADALRLKLVPATGCASFPEMTVNAKGTPFKGTDSAGRVKGFIDPHAHLMAYEFMGGYFHCGRPWSPYGVTVALQDCQGDAQLSTIADNVLSGKPVSAPLDGGWPDFKNWPRRDSLLREATYWKQIERAWLAGQRIIVNDLVQNTALCEIWPVKYLPCDDMQIVKIQYESTLELQDYIDAQYGGPGKGFFRVVRSPRAARKVIEQGKLAVVNSIETSAMFGCSQFQGTPRCSAQQIDKGFDDLQRMGIVGFFPIHKFDNALGGVKYDEATTGLLVGIGQQYISGQWWYPQRCPADQHDHDNTPTGFFGPGAYDLLALLGVPPGTIPAYPEAPLCNPLGLTALGKYVINEMMSRGFIVETDHMSVKARRETLDMLEQSKYPGLISSHSWGDEGSTKRLQALGGMVSPIVGGGSPGSNMLYAYWQQARANKRSDLLFGLGFSSDIGGLAKQYGPLPIGPLNNDTPVSYPFRSYDGKVEFDKHKNGNRTFDYEQDGVAQYGLYADWLEKARITSDPQLMTDMFNGAEAYLQLWERTRRAGGRAF